jgi:glutamate-1-semialdehyde 2,1-aminomutase
MSTYASEPVIETLHARGERLRTGVEEVARAHGVQDHFTVAGRGSCLFFGTADADGHPSQAFRTLFLQETITRGLLAPSFVVSYSHGEEDVDRTIEIVDEALPIYAAALEDGVERFLRGRPVKPVHRRFN